jgi:hypothetical protein
VLARLLNPTSPALTAMFRPAFFPGASAMPPTDSTPDMIDDPPKPSPEEVPPPPPAEIPERPAPKPPETIFPAHPEPSPGQPPSRSPGEPPPTAPPDPKASAFTDLLGALRRPMWESEVFGATGKEAPSRECIESLLHKMAAVG